MKFYSNQLSDIANSISQNRINSMLFYGPDHGLVEYSIGQIAKILNIERRNISYEEVYLSEISNMLNNISLFGNRELICIKDLPTTIDAPTKELFKTQHHHMLVAACDELAPSSSLRKLFEQEQNLGAVACYNDNEDSVEKIIRSYITKEKKTLHPDALKFLKYNLHGDRYIIINELEKLFCYAINKENITLKDVEGIISTDASSEPDMLSLYFLSKDMKNYFIELEKILNNNISGIWIVRAIIRYHINAYIILSKMNEGVKIDDAISELSPQIFFKYKPIFRQAIINLSYKEIIARLNILYKAEKEMKLGLISQEQICTNMFFEIT